MKYFTADQHFNHKNIIEACDRRWKNVWAMNAYMIEAWNKIVKAGDVVYHLGDFALPNKGDGDSVEEILEQLNGQIYLIKGNHDDRNISLFEKNKKIVKIVDIAYIKIQIGKKLQRVMLCHYPMLSWRASHYGSWHLHGHCHGKIPARRSCLDVGVDSVGYFPLSEDDIIKMIWE